MGKLSATGISKAKAKLTPYVLSDGDGLRLRVATNGDKSWHVRYTVHGAEKIVTLPRRYGVPTDDAHLSLESARDEARVIRALARDGIDYQQMRKDEREAEAREREKQRAEALTVRDLFNAWFPEISTKRGKRGRKDGGAEVQRTFGKFVMDRIGKRLLSNVYASDVRPILTEISDAGNNRQATALLVDLKQMFRWGDQNQPWKRLLAASDVLAIKPEHIVSGGYDPVRDNERDRVLSESEIRQFAKLLPAADLTQVVEHAIWIMLAVGSRVGETVAARWSHVDLEKGTWHIPAENAKSNVSLDVSLSDFALSHFTRLRAMRDALPEEKRSDWVFPSRTDRLKPLNNQTVGKALADRQRPDGKPITGRTEKVDALALAGGQWKCHDLRRTAGTVMQSLGVPESIIHRCLNHARTDKLDRIYLQHDYSDEMGEAWRLLGDRLELLGQCDAANIVTLRSA